MKPKDMRGGEKKIRSQLKRNKDEMRVGACTTACTVAYNTMHGIGGKGTVLAVYSTVCT